MGNFRLWKHTIPLQQGLLLSIARHGRVTLLVTVRDVCSVAQRLEMVRRIAREVSGYVVELGTDGRLLSLQLDELVSGVENDRVLVVRDYLPAPAGKRSRKSEASHVELDTALDSLDALGTNSLIDLAQIAQALRLDGTNLDQSLNPRGYRLLARVPRLPDIVVERLVDHFGSLQRLLSANIDDLQAVEGVGETRARSVREGLSRLAETSILERFV